jgi:hypothetical protein
MQLEETSTHQSGSFPMLPEESRRICTRQYQHLVTNKPTWGQIFRLLQIVGWEPNRVKYLTIKLELEQTKNDAAEHPN